MAAPLYAKESVVEPMIGNLLDRVADVPQLTISSLIEEIFNLLNQSVIQQDQEAKSLLNDRLKQISARNGMDPIQKSEQVFYNFSQQLVDRQGRLNRHCLDMLKGISLEKPLSSKKQAFQIELQEMRKEINRLKEKLDRYMSMVAIPEISMPSTNGVHQIPAQIPQHATHILLYCIACTGGDYGNSSSDMKLSNSRGQNYRFFYKTYQQNAWSYNSENIWMEICPLRQITISGRGHPCMTISIIGYK